MWIKKLLYKEEIKMTMKGECQVTWIHEKHDLTVGYPPNSMKNQILEFFRF